MQKLNEFIKMNLSNSVLFETYDMEDRNIIINNILKKLPIEDDFLDKFNSTGIKTKVLRNFEISKLIQKARNLIKEPCSGDVFIDDLGRKFRLVNVHGGEFQFCKDGSFWISSNGYASMSGGFAFDIKQNGKEIGSITSKELKNIKEKELRRFWFFKDNSSGASRGLYFDCEVSVFKSN